MRATILSIVLLVCAACVVTFDLYSRINAIPFRNSPKLNTTDAVAAQTPSLTNVFETNAVKRQRPPSNNPYTLAVRQFVDVKSDLEIILDSIDATHQIAHIIAAPCGGPCFQNAYSDDQLDLHLDRPETIQFTLVHGTGPSLTVGTITLTALTTSTATFSIQ